MCIFSCNFFISATNELDQIDLDMAQAQLDFNTGLLEDYDPPPLDYNETNEEHEENSKSIGDRIAEQVCLNMLS